MNWLKTELLTGFQKLLCLGLDRTPASEVIPGTVEAWLEAVTANRLWDQDRDTSRIRQAFVTLARTRRLWPAPVDFLEALPAIRNEFLALPKATPTPEHAAKVLAEIRSRLGVAS
jgi:hypothetical protein